MPKLLGAILVRNDQQEPEIADKSEVEIIGMEITMEYERSQGREPEDVSADNLGFDIKSKDESGNVRYIEVKARKNEGLVKLTLNEWFKAKRFRDKYWLYVVANATEIPSLYVLQDPIYNLKANKYMKLV